MRLETAKFGKITQNKAISPFKVTDFAMVPMKAHIRLPISD